MANPYFQFKQFTVYHDRCAMKVGTDGVLLGAWTTLNNAQKVLDIGCGSGLISLMLAQRSSNIRIDAIDIDVDAVEQTQENVTNSVFGKSIDCRHLSLQEFDKENTGKYDLIVSNPPFFVQSLKSPDQQRTLARHTDSLYIDELIVISAKHLSEKGRISIIFPSEQKELLVKLAQQNNLFVSHLVDVYPTPTSKPKRVLIELSKEEKERKEGKLIIEIERHVYSDEFTQLVKDFYLKL